MGYIAIDSTSDQSYDFTATTVGTYNLTFSFGGQAYGANGDGYSGSILVNDTYLPSSASTTLTVQSTPITAAVISEPLPTDYWSRPIYGENSNWYTISSNWLGSGSAFFHRRCHLAASSNSVLVSMAMPLDL